MWYTWYCRDNYTVRNIKGMGEGHRVTIHEGGRASSQYLYSLRYGGGGGGRLACAPGSYAYEV